LFTITRVIISGNGWRLNIIGDVLIIWIQVSVRTEGAITVPRRSLNLELWWDSEIRGLPSQQKKQRAAILIYTTWNIWNERNRRIFEGKSATPARVIRLIKEEMALLLSACEGEVQPQVH
jgi:hypothetical protein